MIGGGFAVGTAPCIILAALAPSPVCIMTCMTAFTSRAKENHYEES